MARPSNSSRPNDAVDIVPLGGLGEVGMNCMTIEAEGGAVILDCGVTFPGGHLGVNLIHPDFAYLDSIRSELRAVLITHGHEDHIGAMPFLARHLGDDMPPVYAPPYAIELMKRRFGEFEGVETPELRPMVRARSFGVGPFEVEPFRVNHSIVDALGVVLRTPAGVVVHSGDFKIEEAPPLGEPFDLPRLRDIADSEGIDLLMSDSTNVDNAGRAGNEADAADAVASLVEGASGRVVIAQFASNIYRMRGAFEAAKRHHRKVLMLGRSVENHAFVARKLGFIRGYDHMIVSAESARSVPRDQLLVIATGTQGERPAALGRLARGEHRDLDLEAGDRVVLSSRIIPGQEKHVYAMIDALERRGLEVHHRRSDPGVHVSGHACRDEQRELIESLKPAAFLAVHGSFHMLRAHTRLAEDCGVNSLALSENGDRVRLQGGEISRVGREPIGRVHIARREEVTTAMLHDRALLVELGVATVAFALRRGRLSGMPEVDTRGFISDEANGPLCEDCADFVARDLRRHKSLDPDEAEDIARRAVKRYFGRHLRRKPLVISLAVEAADR